MADKKEDKKKKLHPTEDYIINYDHSVERAAEKNRLGDIFTDLQGHKEYIADMLIDELASLKAEMIILKTQYEWYGSVDEMEQGEYTVLRQSPYFKNYLDSLKQYVAIYKQINDLYPKEEQKMKVTQELDGLQSFMKKYNS